MYLYKIDKHGCVMMINTKPSKQAKPLLTKLAEKQARKYVPSTKPVGAV